jgi:hypothetical protein
MHPSTFIIVSTGCGRIVQHEMIVKVGRFPTQDDPEMREESGWGVVRADSGVGILPEESGWGVVRADSGVGILPADASENEERPSIVTVTDGLM